MTDTTLGIAQGFLALFFLAAGVPKIAGRGIDRWVGFDDLPRALTLLIGIAEIAGAVALVVPMAIDVGRWTTPLAALGIATVSLMASGFHIRRAEWLPALETTLWAALAGSIAIGRWDQLATGPSISRGVLVLVVAVLVPAIVVNIVLIFRQPVEQVTPPASVQEPRPAAPAR
ncbi:MAG TPA: DoxX family protein [Marmoricola sp.]